MIAVPRRTDRSGYVLLLVLATLAIASMSLVGVANRSLKDNTRSLASVEALQSKWSRLSCRKAVLPFADKLFEAMESADNGRTKKTNVWQLRDRIILGGQTLEMVLSDEDAKSNLNSIAIHGGRSAVATALRDLVDPAYHRCLKQATQGFGPDLARVDPDTLALSGRDERIRTFDNWGDVIDLNAVRRQDGDDRSLVAMTGRVTLWGSGRLNVHRASDEAILAQCAAAVTKGLAERVLETLKEATAKAAIEVVLQRTVENNKDQDRLTSLLSNGSTTFSLWTEATTGKGHRHQHLSLRTIDDKGRVTTLQFSLD